MSQKKRLLLKRIALFVLGIGLALCVFTAAVYRFLFPVLPQITAPKEVVRLDQGWTPNQREKYYQTSQGSLIIPYSWFMALEMPQLGNHAPFSSEENLIRYDLVPDTSEFNPDNLPVGVGRETVDDDHLKDLGCGAPPCPSNVPLHREWLTYTCAACHVSQINYRGKSIIVDGGRGRWNFTVFNTTLANLLLKLAIQPVCFRALPTRSSRMKNGRTLRRKRTR